MILSRDEEDFMKDLSRKLVARKALSQQPLQIDLIEILASKFKITKKA